MLSRYASLGQALVSIYGDYEWDTSRLDVARAPYKFWLNPANHRKALDRIGKELGSNRFVKTTSMTYSRRHSLPHVFSCRIGINSLAATSKRATCEEYYGITLRWSMPYRRCTGSIHGMPRSSLVCI